MPTDRQNEARRRNAQRSTGPRTPEGKARVSQNARKHGLTVADATLRTESLAEFAELLDEYMRQWRPLAPTARDMVIDLVTARLRLTRLTRVESGLYDSNSPTLSSASTRHEASQAAADAFRKAQEPLDRLERYRAAAERSWERALKALHAAPRDWFAPESAAYPVEVEPNCHALPARPVGTTWTAPPVPLDPEDEERRRNVWVFWEFSDDPADKTGWALLDIVAPDGSNPMGVRVPPGAEPPAGTMRLGEWMCRRGLD